MAGINDYSNTAGSNTTINGIDISEGCSPAGINNAIRQLMADIANMDDGVVPLQTPDINGGTIDGAALGASSPITSAVISGDLTVDTDTLYVDSTNNRVGIGTSSPSASLTVDTDLSILNSTGNNLIFKGTASTTTGGIDFQNNTESVAVIDVSGGSGKITFQSDPNNTVADSLIRFDVDGSEAMRIESDGKVGIGTTTPSVPLHINSGGTNQVAKFESTDNNAYIAFADDSTTVLTYIGAQGDALTAGVGFEAMRIDSNGNVLVGTTSATINSTNFGIKLDADGPFANSFDVGATSSVARFYGNAGQARVRGDGDLENTNNSYTAISDRRLKENETSANSQWNDIKALQIKNYNLIEYPDRRHIGVIAQDLEETGMNGLVKTDDEGLKSVKYSIIYMKAVKCLQEAQTKIETLESTVADLTARLETLENA